MMKFRIEKKNLINAVKFSNSVCGMSTSYSPILSCLYFEVTKDKMVITSSSSFISGRYVIEGDKYECLEEGKFLVKTKIVHDIVSKLSDGIITFTLLESNQLSISANEFESTLLLLDYEEYPNIDFVFDPGNISECKFNTNELLEAEERISNLVASEENATVFSSINFNITNKLLTVSASDSFKLGSISFPNESNDVKFNIDPSSLKLITSLFKPNEEVTFKIKDNKARIDYNEMTLVTRLNDGTFPSFNNFLKAKEGNKIVVERKKLLAAVERGIIVISNKTSPSATFQIKSDNNLTILFKSNEIGTASETISLQENSGNDFSFVLNIQLLLPVLKNFSGDILEIWFKKDIGITFFKDKEQENFFQIVAVINTES